MNVINSLITQYNNNHRDIKALSFVVIAILSVNIYRVASHIYCGDIDNAWLALNQCIPLLAALVAIRIANRLIYNAHVHREDDRRQDIVRVSHFLIATTIDLQGKIAYFRKMITEGGRTTIALIKIAESIESRYEALLDRDGFRYIPSQCANIITKISSDIFVITAVAESIKLHYSKSPDGFLIPIDPVDDLETPQRLVELLNDLQNLLDSLYELRNSIDSTAHASR